MSGKQRISFMGHNFDRIEYLINDNFDEYYKLATESGYVPEVEPEDEPAYLSYISLDVELEQYCTDVSNIFEYSDAENMQQNLLSWIKNIVTPELLEHIRNGNIKNLTVRIGPNTLSGRDLSKGE